MRRQRWLWALGGVGAVLVAGAVVSMVTVASVRARARDDEQQCRQNLAALRDAVELYRNTNAEAAGKFPADLTMLSKQTDFAPAVFSCPGAKASSGMGYVYVD